MVGYSLPTPLRVNDHAVKNGIEGLWMIRSIIASEIGASPEGLIRSYSRLGAYSVQRAVFVKLVVAIPSNLHCSLKCNSKCNG
jgi:hypothetical protein